MLLVYSVEYGKGDYVSDDQWVYILDTYTVLLRAKLRKKLRLSHFDFI